MRYQFDLTVHRVTMAVPFQTNLSIIFSRGNYPFSNPPHLGPKRQETKTKLRIGKELSSVDFKGETLSMLGTIYKNKAQGTFVERNVRGGMTIIGYRQM